MVEGGDVLRAGDQEAAQGSGVATGAVAVSAPDDLYEHVLRYFFHSYHIVVRGLGEDDSIRDLRHRAVEARGGYYGELGTAYMDCNHHIKVWPGREVGPPAIDVTVDRAARDAYALLYAPARQERLL